MNDAPTTSTLVTIGDIRLRVLDGNADAQWYGQRGVFEERESQLYPMVERAGFRTFIDVGSNYGFVSILVSRAVPEVKIIAIEADERLIPFIRENFDTNGVTGVNIIHAIAGSKVDSSATFSLNPASTLDNRVSMDGWEKASVRTCTVDDILDAQRSDGPVFVKIDTQGFEREVLAGAMRLLTERDDWMIKMEFAPMWLRSQAVDPTVFLHWLCDRFQVAEFPARIPYFTHRIESLFEVPIDRSRVDRFVQYVEALNRDNRGWVELIVRPSPNV